LIDNLSSTPLLSVIVIGHNDEKEIVPLINEIRSALQTHVEYEIIFVDDASTDGSVYTLQQVAQSVANLRVLRLVSVAGPTGALRAGIDASQAAWVVTLNGDGSNDPADIASMFEMVMQYEGSAPLLIAGHRGGSWRNGAQHLTDGLSTLFRRVLNGEQAGIDSDCTFRICSRDLYQRLPWFDHLHRYIPALVTRAGGRVISVPINHRSHTAKKDGWGKVGLFTALRDGFGVRWLQRRICAPRVADADTLRRG
jgi:dolichol-phosphate mannosyltransferase